MKPQPQHQPWFNYPIMWLVVAPPLLSVVAGVITMVLILKAPEADVRIPHPKAVVLNGNAAGSLLPPKD